MTANFYMGVSWVILLLFMADFLIEGLILKRGPGLIAGFLLIFESIWLVVGGVVLVARLM